MFLHAARITFTDPGSGQILKLEAPLPPELQAAVQRLRLK